MENSTIRSSTKPFPKNFSQSYLTLTSFSNYQHPFLIWRNCWKPRLKIIPTLKHQRIGEHSLIESLDFEPSTGARCMGLHALEMGIFSKKTFVRRFILAATPPPTPTSLLFEHSKGRKLFTSHSFNLAYTRTFRGTYLYLHILCKGLSKRKKISTFVFLNSNSCSKW